MKLLYTVFLLLGLCAFTEIHAQVFKFKKAEKNSGVTIKTLSNGNTNKQWKKVIERNSRKPKSNDLIADALFVDFGKVTPQSKEASIFVGNVYEPTTVEVFYIGDNEFFSLDIGDKTNFWFTQDTMSFVLPVMLDEKLEIKFRTNALSKGTKKAYLAFKIGKQLVRVALKSNVTEALPEEHEEIEINLGHVEADSVEFTDYIFSNLEEYPLEFNYQGDTSAFVFMINYDTIPADSVRQIVSTSDTTILSVAALANNLGDHYGQITFKNMYLEQKVQLTSRVVKIRGDLIWADTLNYDQNIQLLSKELYTPNDSVFYQLKIFNDSDYDTLIDINKFVELQTEECLSYHFPETLMKPRETTLVRIPLYLNKSCDLGKPLNTTMNLMILKDSSVVSQTIQYDPISKIKEELLSTFPKELTFTSNKDTVEIKVPYFNLGRNARYPDLKSFIDEIEKPSSIDLFYYPPRIKGYHKGYVSIFLTPFDSIAFHQEHHEQYKATIHGEEVITKVHLVQKPWTAIVADYTTEIIISIVVIILIVLGILSPKIIKVSKQKWALYLFNHKKNADITAIHRCIELTDKENIQSELKQILEEVENRES
ncbi:hypothetical protein KMW28_28165 [Flammeovirga yaeyamensis]|uniref:BatD protein n=1 Tax=Flammeovirga yaeyamensis TaxID=367791 RepID=A0AAX1NBA8_9BACT|nr:hypothetical protein [Flammeovirga yaeyamensis]MBB3697310.1 hypothetical protein [Flammeovirga yaeyamensis]NMF33966.1 hypothetical protein [Flammeovirga yaeyamensis]QWG04774.1 hypothetical protein KMW28_28165 [Flammeovirga yaeyamensis]